MNCHACDSLVFPGDDQCESCGVDLVDNSFPTPLEGRLHELILEDPISRLNAPTPLTLKAGDSVATAVELMRKRRYGSVLIVDDDGALEGIFTERDLLVKLSAESVDLQAIALSDVMTAKPKTLREDATLAQAINRMALGGYRHIPVVCESRPVGFVSIRGILQYVSKNAL